MEAKAVVGSFMRRRGVVMMSALAIASALSSNLVREIDFVLLLQLCAPHTMGKPWGSGGA